MTKEWRLNFPWSLTWSYRVFWEWIWYYAHYLGWIWPFMFTGGAIFFTNFTPWWNILDWRSFNSLNANMQWLHSFDHLGDYSNHHFINLAAESAACFFIAFWFAKQLNQSVFKQGIIATYGAVLIWSIHEGLWWIVYYGMWLGYNPYSLNIFSGLGELVTLGLLVFTPLIGLYQPRKFFILMCAFYVCWVAVGFPITESYKGSTQWYGTLWGDAWETGSWIFAVIAFCKFEMKPFLAWYNNLRGIINRVAPYQDS